MKKKRPLKRRGRGGKPEYTSRKADLPTDEFCDWWNPTGTQQPSGAHTGGHPDAKRIWARKDPGRWVRRTYGTTANLAWLCEPYRREFQRWLDAGKPARTEFVSLALPLKEQRERYDAIERTIKFGTMETFGPPEEDK